MPVHRLLLISACALVAVGLPSDVRLQPQPVFAERGFVALAIDAAGVPRLVRYEVTRTAGR